MIVSTEMLTLAEIFLKTHKRFKAIFFFPQNRLRLDQLQLSHLSKNVWCSRPETAADLRKHHWTYALPLKLQMCYYSFLLNCHCGRPALLFGDFGSRWKKDQSWVASAFRVSTVAARGLDNIHMLLSHCVAVIRCIQYTVKLSNL